MSERDLVRRGSVDDRLYTDLLNGILAGDFPVNSHLPPEERIATDYGVSRSTVRSALARLKNEDYIVSRQGSGTLVKRGAPADIEPFAPVESLADLEKCYECRIALETEIAALAARRRDKSDVAALERHIRDMRRIVDAGGVYTAEDLDFHLMLARMSRNQFFESILVSIRPHIVFGMNISKTLGDTARRGHAWRCLAEHERIVDAVIASNPAAARDSTRRHLERSRRRLFGRLN